MMMMMGAGAAMLLLAQAAAGQADATTPAQGADDKYTYFSQPGADRAQVLADWDECRDLASAVQPPRAGFVYSPNPIAAGVNGFMQGLVRGAQRRHMFDAALRKCMHVKGYARHAMTKDEAKALYDGKWADLRVKLADKAIAPADAGTRLEW